MFTGVERRRRTRPSGQAPYGDSTRDALILLAQRQKVLMLELHASEKASGEEAAAWGGINMLQRAMLRLIMPPIPGKTLPPKWVPQAEGTTLFKKLMQGVEDRRKSPLGLGR